MASVSARTILVITTIIILSGCRQDTPDQSPTSISQPDRPMNCLVIVLDAFRARDSSIYGYPEPTTPNLEKWAKHGVVFENATSQFTSTSGSSWSYLNGLYPYRSEPFSPMRANDVPLAELFKRIGYRTGGFSDNPFITETQRTNKGFAHFEYHKFDSSVPQSADDPSAEPRKSERSEFLFDRLEQWIRNGESDPWFAYIHTLRPHNPYAAPEPFLSKFADTALVPEEEDTQEFFVKYEREFFPQFFKERWTMRNIEQLAVLHTVYLSGIAYIDSLVDSLLASLKDTGQLNNTFIVITSDHGEAFGEHEDLLHGGGPFREQNHVPLIIVPPSRTNIGPIRVSTPIALVDLLPTLNEVFKLNDENRRDGQSLVPLMRMHPGYESRPVFSQSPDELAVIRDEYKLIVKIQQDSGPEIDGDNFRDFPKYRRDKRAENISPRLYNLREDPEEINDLYPESTIASELITLAVQYLETQSGNPKIRDAVLPDEEREALKALGYLQE